MFDITAYKRGPRKSGGKRLRGKRFGPVHQFLLSEYKNQDLLKGLYQIACGERYLFKNDTEQLLKQHRILNADGSMSDETRDLVMDSIIIKPDGTVYLELG